MPEIQLLAFRNSNSEFPMAYSSISHCVERETWGGIFEKRASMPPETPVRRRSECASLRRNGVMPFPILRSLATIQIDMGTEPGDIAYRISMTAVPASPFSMLMLMGKWA